jgi:hypothetical protein
MSVRLIAAAVLLASTASLAAAEPSRAETKLAPRLPLHLTALFERASDVVVTGTGMVVTESDAPEVLVARIGADGRAVIGCVNDAKSARAFFDARRVNGSKAQEK